MTYESTCRNNFVKGIYERNLCLDNIKRNEKHLKINVTLYTEVFILPTRPSFYYQSSGDN